jgi:hypothetical protein
MRKLTLDIPVMNVAFAVAVLALASPSSAQYVITEIIDETGDGGGNGLWGPYGVAVGHCADVYLVYVVGPHSRNAFRIQPVSQAPVLSNPGLVILGASLLGIAFWVARRQRIANA